MAGVPVVTWMIIDDSILGESGHRSLEIEAVCCFNVGGHRGWRGDRSVRGTGKIMVGVLGYCTPNDMPIADALGTLCFVKK
jgi:hypothetical protein